MSEPVLEVTDATFDRDVVQRSRSVPVVVDFWAPWCGPCRTLGPDLESLASEAAGRWILAKVNADENPELLRRWQVRGIPAVKAFVNGEMVDEFTGALPKAAIVAFLENVVPSRVSELARRAAEASGAGNRALERELWEEVLRHEPDHELALVRRARFLLSDGKLDEALSDLRRIPDESPLADEAAHLGQLADWARRLAGRGSVEEIRERAAEEPGDPARRHELACALAVSGDFEGALAEFLEVVRADRTFEDDGGRRGMLAIFALLGDAHPLTRRFRGELSALLF